MKEVLSLVTVVLVIVAGVLFYQHIWKPAGEAKKDVKEVIKDVGKGIKKAGKAAGEKAQDAARIVTGGSTKHGAELGGECIVGTDCKGYTAPRKAGVACCDGKCQQTKKDYAGVYWCPAKCRSGPLAKSGSC